MLTRRWGVEPSTPADGSMLASMATIEVPAEARKRFASFTDLQSRLYNDHRIEVPVIEWDGRWWIRASCQVYNTAGQYERLAEAVMTLLGEH